MCLQRKVVVRETWLACGNRELSRNNYSQRKRDSFCLLQNQFCRYNRLAMDVATEYGNRRRDLLGIWLHRNEL